ncbi:MAG: CPBP family intramembrane metalloprotease, partial [Phycisphaerae bacterium]|nr:CPBP family intramembrane metalloprotease [Phycisphaerae bacterium]
MMSSRSGQPGEALMFTAGMAVFALCAHREALLLPRLAGLLIAVLALAMGIAKAHRPCRLLGITGFARYRLIYILPAVGLGIGLAMFYRCVQHQTLLPERLKWFFILAAGIGICEEIAYRGFVQGALRRYGLWAACVGGAVAHAAYKCCLFILPDVPVRADLLWLGAGTVVFGIVFALMREAFGSVLFPVLAHVAFDVATYGDLTSP